jgi:15-cis-phytoene synthase
MRDPKLRDPHLRAGYRQCARLTWRHGTTYYWGTRLLRPERRRHVYAVYALCRLADDIVDFPPEHAPALRAAEPRSDYAPRQAEGASTEERLLAFAASFRAAVASGSSEDPVLAAVAHTVQTCQIDLECFDRFFGAMAMDLTTSTYETWEDLCGYMEGSAAVIGEMMLPVLEPRDPAAHKPARALGLAFQLTNFLRDVDEDLDRGRVYVPQADLRRFGVDLRERRVTPEWRACLAYEIERNRALYAFADTGIKLLPPRSARCVGAARVLYAQILDRIERNDYDVFSRRAQVPTTRKAITAGRILVTGP